MMANCELKTGQLLPTAVAVGKRSIDTRKGYIEQDREPDPAKKPFLIKEKISDMMKYAVPVVDKFPRRCRYLADLMRESMVTMLELSIRLEKKYYKKTTLEDIDIELEVLRNLVVLASDRDYVGPKYAPPLSLHQREVWSRYTTEIGKMIGGYKKSINK